ncbi:unnamed protein product [Brassica napus]|uniref:(rape) hypothetical protein n=1 Tax=Brassica napus TaxID=3708 RepID=A0A816RLG2_BRANA|nr:unnamed protein product [Brassica napus]
MDINYPIDTMGVVFNTEAHFDDPEKAKDGVLHKGQHSDKMCGNWPSCLCLPGRVSKQGRSWRGYCGP